MPRLGHGVKSGLEDLLVYVQLLKPAPGSLVYPGRGQARSQVTDDDIEMFRVVREMNRDGTRHGIIAKLTDIWRYIELVPRFGKSCTDEWNSENACELATEFYVNCFADKDIYQSVY